MKSVCYLTSLFLALYSFTSQAQSSGGITSANDEGIPNLSAISVTLGGSSFATGTFPASPNERVDQFLTRIFMKAEKNTPALSSFSKRNITLKRTNGEILHIDLLKFQLTGDYKYNPYLKNEDVLIIPPLDLMFGFVSIQGAVSSAQTFQYVEGDKLSDAILFAQGINPASENITKVLINRLSTDGNTAEEITANISDNPLLKRGDRITVLSDELFRKDFKVFVDGEVYHTGFVPITKSNSTLRMVIARAGGIKPTADLNRAELIRGPNAFRSSFFSEDLEKVLMLRMSNISYEDSFAFALDNKLRFSRGNAIIDFSKVMDENSADGNFIVKSGDYIYIPEMVELVYVFGQVNTPGFIKYKKNEHVEYYLGQAGGVGKTAKSEIFLIKGKSRCWKQISKSEKVEIEPGDYIWVPKKPIRYFSFYLQQIASFVSIIGGIATLFLLLTQFNK
jgi:protein involved in polysaccharide export with SLBB domain